MRKALIALAGLAVAAASLSACAQPVGPVPLASRSVTYGHVQVDLPLGWKSGPSRPCQSQPETVVINGPGLMQVAHCPAALADKNPVKSLIVSSVYGSNFLFGWTGTPINWEGQQAWLTVEPAPKPHMSAHASLTLPWLNTRVSATAADVVTARALLDNVHVNPATTLEVPTSADSVAVNAVNANPPVKYADQNLIKALLIDLTSLPIESPSAICAKVLKSGMSKYTTLTFTKSGTESTFMIPRDGCQQVTSGTGVAARTNHQFWLDFDSHFGNPMMGGPFRVNPASLQRPATVTPAAPKNAFHFDASSYMYPAPAATTPKFTRKQLGTELHGLAFWNGVSAQPQVVLAMATGPFTGRNGKPALMWVLRWPGEQIPNYGPGCHNVNGRDSVRLHRRNHRRSLHQRCRLQRPSITHVHVEVRMACLRSVGRQVRVHHPLSRNVVNKIVVDRTGSDA